MSSFFERFCFVFYCSDINSCIVYLSILSTSFLIRHLLQSYGQLVIVHILHLLNASYILYWLRNWKASLFAGLWIRFSLVSLALFAACRNWICNRCCHLHPNLYGWSSYNWPNSVAKRFRTEITIGLIQAPSEITQFQGSQDSDPGIGTGSATLHFLPRWIRICRNWICTMCCRLHPNLYVWSSRYYNLSDSVAKRYRTLSRIWIFVNFAWFFYVD